MTGRGFRPPRRLGAGRGVGFGGGPADARWVPGPGSADSCRQGDHAPVALPRDHLPGPLPIGAAARHALVARQGIS